MPVVVVVMMMVVMVVVVLVAILMVMEIAITVSKDVRAKVTGTDEAQPGDGVENRAFVAERRGREPVVKLPTIHREGGGGGLSVPPASGKSTRCDRTVPTES